MNIGKQVSILTDEVKIASFELFLYFYRKLLHDKPDLGRR